MQISTCFYPQCVVKITYLASLEQWLTTFWHQGPVSWKSTFPLTEGRAMVSGWFKNVHSPYTSFQLLLHPLYLKSSGLRSQRLGTPALENSATKNVCLAGNLQG